MRMMRGATAMVLCAGALVSGCGRARTDAASDGDVGLLHRVAAALGLAASSDSVGDSRAIPHYTTRSFTSEERQLLLTAFGIEDPSKLYVADSTEDGLLKYDTKVKRCLDCFVNTYGVGFVSVRRPGETWEQAEQRVHTLHRRDFPSTALIESVSMAALALDTRATFEQMLDSARKAGFKLHVVATYRSPDREAFLMSQGGNRTHTLTSMHSYGRAIDVVVNDGNLRHPRTRAAWTAFRQWLVDYDQHEFRVLGRPAHSWDWRHVEIPSLSIGFRSIDDALAAARKCDGGNEPEACVFPPNLPAGVAR